MKKQHLVLIGLLVSTLILSACGGGPAPVPSGGARPAPNSGNAPEPTKQAPTQAAPGEPSATSDTGSAPLDLKDVTAGLDELNSYKSTFVMTFEGTDNGQPKTSSFQSVEEYVKSPAAKRTTVTGMNASSGNATTTPEENTFQMIEVNGKQFVQFGTTCMQQTASEAPRAASMLNPSDIIGSVHGAQRVGTETVNGVPTVHYKTDAQGALGYVNAQGDVWVAQPGNFVVKYTFQATGKDTYFGNTGNEGTIKWSYEIQNINQPIDIRPPENCGSAASDIPIMSDAENQSAMGTTTTYTSPSKFEDVVAFYDKEMKTQGWAEQNGGMSAAGISQKSYTKDNRSVQVMITSDQSGGTTTVLIMEGK